MGGFAYYVKAVFAFKSDELERRRHEKKGNYWMQISPSPSLRRLFASALSRVWKFIVVLSIILKHNISNIPTATSLLYQHGGNYELSLASV